MMLGLWVMCRVLRWILNACNKMNNQSASKKGIYYFLIHMSKLLQIAQLGHPVLRKVASKVSSLSIKDKELQNLINDMLVTVKKVNGVGIAAPQVYKPRRIFIIASYPNPRYPQAPKMRPTVMINPRIIEYSKEQTRDWEGCLSIPGIRALVPRYSSIKVEYITRSGKKITRILKDFVARIIQHEYDHLEGLVFLDRIETTKNIISEKVYKKIIANKSYL